MRFEEVNHGFKWISKGCYSVKKKNIRHEAFSIGDTKINVGDYVLIRNEDALDPEDDISSYVAQVKDLFDTGNEHDPHQAQVQWYSRISELPHYASKYFKTAPHKLEIIQEKRRNWSNHIDAETIFKKCEVLFLPLDADCDSILSEYIDHPFPVFFCRYVFTGRTLVAIMNQDNILKMSNSLTSLNTGITNGLIPLAHRKQRNDNVSEASKLNDNINGIYSATSVGDPKFPKVLIKRIDDKILQSENEKIKIIVADTNTTVMDDVTKQFMNNLRIDKPMASDEYAKNKPIIHKLTVRNNENFIIDPKEIELKCNSRSFEADLANDEISVRKNSAIGKNNYNLSIEFINDGSLDSRRSSLRKSVCLRGSPEKRHKFNTELNNLKNITDCNMHSFLMDSDEEFKNSKIHKMKNVHSKKESLINYHSSHRKSSRNYKQATLKLIPETKAIESEACSSILDLDMKYEMPKSLKSATSKKKSLSTPKSCKKKHSVNGKISSNKIFLAQSSIECPSPEKKAKVVPQLDVLCQTRSGRKVKAVNYGENNDSTMKWEKSVFDKLCPLGSPQKKMPGFVQSSGSDSSDNYFLSDEEDNSDESVLSDCSVDDFHLLPKGSCNVSQKKSKKPLKRISKNAKPVVKKIVDLSIPERQTPLKTPQNVLEESRQRLHVSAVPASLPCREEEYSDIYNFVKGCLCAETGGCMYISGVPGTGKTATVHEVMRNLEEEKELGEVPIFTFLEVNGMWMTDPYQCYVQIFKFLTGKTIAPQQAADLLEKRFTGKGPKKDAVVLLVDELDRLWTRKQTVMYNIFDWPTKQNSKLVVLAIANTMDLPERMMMNRISSRIGLTRKTFQPYTFKQLQEIIMSRIQELNVFDPDAVQLVSRKVAAVSGDARRALDICRFATEVVKVNHPSKKSKKILIGMEHVDAALQQMFSSPLISAIRSSSKIAKLFFQCMLSEFTRTGLEETTLLKIYHQVVACCRFEGLHPPNSCEISSICMHLASSHLILVDNFQNDLTMKIRLNVSSDDVTYALTLK